MDPEAVTEAANRANKRLAYSSVLRNLSQQRRLGFLRTRIATLDNPRSLGEPLSGARLGSYWKYRVGDWRIICDIQDDRIVVRVLRIGNQREIYR